MKVGDVIHLHYLGNEVDAVIVKKANKRSMHKGELYWWLQVTEEYQGTIQEYHWKFMRADRVLEQAKGPKAKADFLTKRSRPESAHAIGSLAIYQGKTLGELINQRIEHLQCLIDKESFYNCNLELEYYTNLRQQFDNDANSIDLWKIDCGIMFDMWADVCMAAVVAGRCCCDDTAREFACAMYNDLMVRYFG